jgi:hypothetical protein
MCVFMHVHACMNTHMHACMNTHMHACMNTHIPHSQNTSICMHVLMYVGHNQLGTARCHAPKPYARTRAYAQSSGTLLVRRVLLDGS